MSRVFRFVFMFIVHTNKHTHKHTKIQNKGEYGWNVRIIYIYLYERANEQTDGQTDRFDDLWACGIWDIGSKASEVWYIHSLGILI